MKKKYVRGGLSILITLVLVLGLFAMPVVETRADEKTDEATKEVADEKSNEVDVSNGTTTEEIKVETPDVVEPQGETTVVGSSKEEEASTVDLSSADTSWDVNGNNNYETEGANPAGLEQVVVVSESITEEEYNRRVNEENNNQSKVIDASKATSNYWTKFSSPYYNYTNNLTANQRTLYNDLYNALYNLIEGGEDCLDTANYGGVIYNLTPVVNYTGLTDSQATYVGYLMLYEHPELYYLAQYVSLSSTGSNGRIRLGMYHDFATSNSRQQTASTIQQSINSALALVDRSASYYEQEKTIHNMLVQNVSYVSDSKYNQSCASVFLYKKTVCAGYSEAFCLLCNACGIPALSMTSSGHEWSQVKLGSYWYGVDVTWDDTEGSLYRYFNKSDASLRKGNSSHNLEAFWNVVGRESCPYDWGSEPSQTTYYNGINYSNVYDYNYYKEHSPDVYNYYKGDGAKMLAHFVNYGMKEGRQGKETFNAYSYRNQYPDLRRAYGWDNLPAYYNHYNLYGIKEGRAGTGCNSLVGGATSLGGADYSNVYDYNYYKEHSPDVYRAYNGDETKMLLHFIFYGRGEGRQGKANFNVTGYKNRYLDLRRAYGSNLYAYYDHYMRYGIYEGRNGSYTPNIVTGEFSFLGFDMSAVYDFNYYQQHNPDIRAAYGNDDIKTLCHFVGHGIWEGRQASPEFKIWTYISNNADLRAAYGWNLPAYVVHYIIAGRYEGRRAV